MIAPEADYPNHSEPLTTTQGLSIMPALHPDLLPPEAPRGDERARLQALADMLAKLLDNALRIPGTNISIGLDPVLGVLPGIGDMLAGLLGLWIIALAVRLHVPTIVLARMGLNVLLNGGLGAIPGIGDLFSVWFRSNARNAALLRQWSGTTPAPSTARDWLFVGGFLLGIASLLIGTILGILWMFVSLLRLMQ